MRAEILYIDECASWAPAGSDLRHALDATGNRDVPIAYTLISTAAEASSVGFAGSPTILIDDATSSLNTTRSAHWRAACTRHPADFEARRRRN